MKAVTQCYEECHPSCKTHNGPVGLALSQATQPVQFRHNYKKLVIIAMFHVEKKFVYVKININKSQSQGIFFSFGIQLL